MGDIRAEALAGPWEAVLVGPDRVINLDELPNVYLDDVAVFIVRGTSAVTGTGHVPVFYTDTDRITVERWFDRRDLVETRWHQAVAMAAGLNAAAGA